jgi:hypothetical protein
MQCVALSAKYPAIRTARTDTLFNSFWQATQWVTTGATGFVLAGTKYICVIPAHSRGFTEWMQAEFPESQYVNTILAGKVPESFGGGKDALPVPTMQQLHRLEHDYGVLVHFHKISGGWAYILEKSAFHMVRNGADDMFVFTVACDQFQHPELGRQSGQKRKHPSNA